MIKSGFYTQSGCERRLLARRKQEEVIATAPPSGPHFVGVGGGGGSDLSVDPLFVRSCNLLWPRGLLQRLDVAPNLGLSPPAVCASAAVRFIFGHSSRGQIAVQWGGGGGRGGSCGKRVGGFGSGCAARQVGQKWSDGDAESLKWRPQQDPAGRDGSPERSPSRAARRAGRRETHSRRPTLVVPLICKHVTCSGTDLPHPASLLLRSSAGSLSCNMPPIFQNTQLRYIRR